MDTVYTDYYAFLKLNTVVVIIICYSLTLSSEVMLRVTAVRVHLTNKRPVTKDGS